MLRQYADRSSPETTQLATTQPSGDSTTAHAAGSGLPGWRIATRRVVTTVVERALGECLAPTPTIGLLVMAAIAGLLAIIAVTLSPGNALLVLIAGVIMRISCEHRSRRR
ncbi:MAG TPA: hypothetical protein VGL06_12730 [Pseudonocardiaceae bacterium]